MTRSPREPQPLASQHTDLAGPCKWWSMGAGPQGALRGSRCPVGGGPQASPQPRDPPAFQVMKEVQSALSTAAADDSKLVLLSAVGSVFCCGLDFIYFIRRLTDDRKRESTKMAEAIRYAPRPAATLPCRASLHGPADPPSAERLGAKVPSLPFFWGPLAWSRGPITGLARPSLREGPGGQRAQWHVARVSSICAFCSGPGTKVHSLSPNSLPFA